MLHQKHIQVTLPAVPLLQCTYNKYTNVLYLHTVKRQTQLSCVTNSQPHLLSSSASVPGGTPAGRQPVLQRGRDHPPTHSDLNTKTKLVPKMKTNNRETDTTENILCHWWTTNDRAKCVCEKRAALHMFKYQYTVVKTHGAMYMYMYM